MPDERPNGIDRRTLLKLAGAAGVLAGCSPAPGPQKLIPYLVAPEEIVPGMPLFYRTVCRECSAGCGVTARTREGRVVKLEGNPDDPIGAGALCARGQAAVQGLYAPERFHGPARRAQGGRLESVTWDEAEAALATALAASRAKGSPPGVWLLTRPEPGSAGALQKEFMEKLAVPPGRRVVLEAFDLSALRVAGKRLFGRAEVPAFDLEQAHTIVSFGADFVETWLSPVELARQFASGRGKVGPERTRLVWIGPRLCVTGVSADTWLSVRAGGEPWAAVALLRFLCDPEQGVAGLAPGGGRDLRRLEGVRSRRGGAAKRPPASGDCDSRRRACPEEALRRARAGTAEQRHARHRTRGGDPAHQLRAGQHRPDRPLRARSLGGSAVAAVRPPRVPDRCGRRAGRRPPRAPRRSVRYAPHRPRRRAGALQKEFMEK